MRGGLSMPYIVPFSQPETPLGGCYLPQWRNRGAPYKDIRSPLCGTQHYTFDCVDPGKKPNMQVEHGLHQSQERGLRWKLSLLSKTPSYNMSPHWHKLKQKMKSLERCVSFWVMDLKLLRLSKPPMMSCTSRNIMFRKVNPVFKTIQQSPPQSFNFPLVIKGKVETN